MGFFKRLFSDPKKSSSKDKRYFNLLAAFQGMEGCTFSQEECEVPGCGTSFILPSKNVLFSIGDVTGSKASLAYNYVINIGGYCPHCKRLVCHNHVEMITVEAYSESDIVKKICCKECETPLIFLRG